MIRKGVMPVDTSVMDVYRSAIYPGGYQDGYQRGLMPRWVEEIAATFNEDCVKQVVLSHRDGKFWIVDGQHTVAALKMRNGGLDLPVECLVYDGFTVQDEARLFMILNDRKYSKPVSALAKASARYGSLNDPELTKMIDAAKRAGVTVVFTTGASKSGTSAALVALDSAWKKLGGEPLFGEMLNNLVAAWGGDYNTLTGPFIAGMTEFVCRFQQKYDKARLSKMLREVPPSDIKRDAKANGGGNGVKYAKVFVKLYNKRLRFDRQLSFD